MHSGLTFLPLPITIHHMATAMIASEGIHNHMQPHPATCVGELYVAFRGRSVPLFVN